MAHLKEANGAPYVEAEGHYDRFEDVGQRQVGQMDLRIQFGACRRQRAAINRGEAARKHNRPAPAPGLGRST